MCVAIPMSIKEVPDNIKHSSIRVASFLGLQLGACFVKLGLYLVVCSFGFSLNTITMQTIT